MNFAQALADLESRQPESMPAPSLDRIRELATLLDHPERTYPSIHVTGTNGKTTTARMITELACQHGLTAGTFVSPHVREVTERLSVCGVEMTGEEFAEEYERLLPYFQRVEFAGGVTYFERLTAMAYLWFADKPVGLAVFEVGMGGTWDATNLVTGDVAVLCPIGLDHVQQLGSTVREIAGEKAGIIKEGATVVVRQQRPEALAVIHGRATEVGATLLHEGHEFALSGRAQALGGQALSIRGLHGTYDELFLPLFGEPLARNAAASVAAVEALLGRALNPDAVRQALREVRSSGRTEVAGRKPLVLLDGAHNPDAAQALVAAVREAFVWERLHLVLGMFGDKDVETVAGTLAPLADRAYACRSSSPRAAPLSRVIDALTAAGAAEVAGFDTVAEAVHGARAAAGERDLILVTGSFYTVADARPLFLRGRT
jgi:dihydrofolate synthase/folylpolyglutamate synthase